MAEGYVERMSNGTFRCVFEYKDHLGNVRVKFTKETASQPVVLEENNYYPFGARHTGYNDVQVANNKYKFQGQER